MGRIVHQLPRVQGGSVAAQEEAHGMAQRLTVQTGKRHTAEWADDYNDHSFTGHFNIVEHS